MRHTTTHNAKFVSVLLAIASSLLMLIADPAHADESLFGYSYTAEALPQGALEFGTALTRRWDKGMGRYVALDSQVEIEYGITDRFTGSVYLLGLAVDHQGAFPVANNTGAALYPDRKDNFFRGAKFNLKYNILSPYLNNGLGLSVFLEPQYIQRFKVDGSATSQIELEGGVIVQKNFFNDQLVLALNAIVSRERRILLDSNNTIEHEWELTNTFGASYRFAPKWSAGIEGRHHMDLLKDPADGKFKKNQFSMYLGPSIHYAEKKWWLTATYLRQVRGDPTYGNSVGAVTGGVTSNLHLDENEKNEFRLKFGYNF